MGVGSSSPAGETAGEPTTSSPPDIPGLEAAQTANGPRFLVGFLPGDTIGPIPQGLRRLCRKRECPSPSPGRGAVRGQDSGLPAAEHRPQPASRAVTGPTAVPPGPSRPAGPPPASRRPFLQNRRNQAIGLLLFAALVLLPIFVMSGPSASGQKELSEVLAALPTAELSGHKITKATIDDDNRVLVLTMDNDEVLQTSYPNQFGTELVKELQAAGIPFTTEPIHKASPLGPIFAMLLPVLLIIAFFVWMSKKGALGPAPPAPRPSPPPRPSCPSRPPPVSPTSSAATRPSTSCRRSSPSSTTRPTSTPPAPRCPGASSWSAPPAPARPSWPGPWPARPACPSTRRPAPTSPRCSSAWAPPGSATSSPRPRRPAGSSSSTRSTPSDGPATATPPAAAPMTSGSRPSTPSSSRWTASPRRTTSSSWPPPTGPTSSTPPSPGPAGSTAR